MIKMFKIKLRIMNIILKMSSILNSKIFSIKYKSMESIFIDPFLLIKFIAIPNKDYF